jgi:hypothetical protein
MTRFSKGWLAMILALGGCGDKAREVLGALAIDADEALLVTRTVGDEGQSFVELVGPETVRWAVETTPRVVGTRLGLVAAAADETRVYALAWENEGRADINGALLAFDRASGRLDWQRDLAFEGVPEPMVETLVASGGRVLASLSFAKRALFAFDAASGQPIWEARGEGHVETFEVGTARVLSGGASVEVREVGSGRVVETLARKGSECRVGERVYLLVGDTLRGVDLAGEDDTTWPTRGVAWLHECARHEGRVLVVGARAEGGLVVAAVGPEGLGWMAPLPGSGVASYAAPGFQVRAGDDEVGARWPLVLDDVDVDGRGQEIERYVVIDTSDGAILEERLGLGGLIRVTTSAGSRVLVGTSGGTTALLDGEGGAVTGWAGEVADFARGHIAAGHLWHVPTHRPAKGQAYVRGVIDLASGKLVAGSGLAPDGRGVAAAFPREGWVRFAPPGEGFSVSFPGRPQRTASPVKGPAGHETEMVQYVLDTPELVLIASVAPLVEQLVAHGHIDLALERIVDQQVNVPNRKLRAKSDAPFLGYPARDLLIDIGGAELNGETALMRARIVMVGTRMHLLVGVLASLPGKPGAPISESPALRRFFDSFTLAEGANLQAIDLWQVHRIEALGLALTLPAKPHVDTLTQRTAFGEASVLRADADSSFPAAGYTVQRVMRPAGMDGAQALKALEAWVLDNDGRPLRQVGRSKGAIAGQTAVRLEVAEADGTGRAFWALWNAGDAAYLARMTALSAETGAKEAQRFFDGISGISGFSGVSAP